MSGRCHEFSGDSEQADILQPGADFQDVLLFGVKVVRIDHLPAEVDDGLGFLAESRMVGADDAVAKFQGMVEVLTEGFVGGVQPYFLLGQLFDILL